MSSIILTASRKYPAIPTVGGDAVSHTKVLEAVRDAIQTHERRTADKLSSFVRVQDLLDLGVVQLVGKNRIEWVGGGSSGGGSGASALADLTDVDLTGLIDGDILVYDSNYGLWLPEVPASSGSTILTALIKDVKSSGSGGGSASGSSWNQRALNTVGWDEIGSVGLSSNQFTLPTGTYRVHIRAPAATSNNHMVRLVNVTDTLTYYGSSQWASNTNGAQTDATLDARFIISGTKTFKVEHYINSTAAGGQALGVALNVGGVSETYTEVLVTKTA